MGREERTVESVAAVPVQSLSKEQPVVTGVIEISAGIARVRIEDMPEAATLRIALSTVFLPTFENNACRFRRFLRCGKHHRNEVCRDLQRRSANNACSHIRLP